ncbi:MAG: guanylate kinase [Holosporales bacterium]|nr:guanylate kinase [Holosporales bacterium]
MFEKHKGILFVLSSPSGGGKTTLAKILSQKDPTLFLSISVTTRVMRPFDVDGRDYCFLTEDAFKRALQDGTFLETSESFGNFYATPRAPIEQALLLGKDVLLILNEEGYRIIKTQFPFHTVGIFLLPPSLDVLKHRLLTRAGNDKTLDQRLAEVMSQMRSCKEYDYCVINENLTEAAKNLRIIITAERQKTARLQSLDHNKDL